MDIFFKPRRLFCFQIFRPEFQMFYSCWALPWTLTNELSVRVQDSQEMISLLSPFNHWQSQTFTSGQPLKSPNCYIWILSEQLNAKRTDSWNESLGYTLCSAGNHGILSTSSWSKNITRHPHPSVQQETISAKRLHSRSSPRTTTITMSTSLK